MTPGVSMMSQTSAPTSARPLRDGDRRAGIVRDRDVAAGQPAEDDALADVRLADERHAQRPRAKPQRVCSGGGTFVDDVTGHVTLVRRASGVPSRF